MATKQKILVAFQMEAKELETLDKLLENSIFSRSQFIRYAINKEINWQKRKHPEAGQDEIGTDGEIVTDEEIATLLSSLPSNQVKPISSCEKPAKDKTTKQILCEDLF